jgi:formamidopyrimidine-DNA glycosylase
LPEGPEVRRIARHLADRVSGRTLKAIEVLGGRYQKKPPSGIEIIAKQLPIRVVGAGCHGKFMYWILDNEYSVWCTLGMTGGWSEAVSKHPRLCFYLDDGELYFNDQRNFGTIKFVRGKFKLIEKLTSLGPDMLAADVGDDVFIKQLRKKNNWEITKVLMDQSIIAGVGNYIKADSLWLAKISPYRTIDDMSDVELSSLNRAINHVMRESFENGGATIKNYKNFDDSGVEYGHKFLVYNQKTDPDGNEVIREQTADGRTTHWCPAVQI